MIALLVYVLVLGSRPFSGAPTSGALLFALTVGSAAGLDTALRAYAGPLAWTRGSADDWVTHASLNAIGVGVILHVAIGRRWPFAATTDGPVVR